MNTNHIFARDPINNVFGGVCAGLARYFKIDRWIVRMAFLALIFLWGFIIPVYLILWMAMPKASENMAATDQPENTSADRTFVETISGFFSGLIQLIFRFFGKIVGFILIFCLSICLLMGWSFLTGLDQFWNVILDAENDYLLFKYAFIAQLILSASLVLMLSFWLMSKKITLSKKWIYAFILAFACSSASIAYLLYETSSLFSKKVVTSQSIPVALPYDSTFRLICSEELALSNTYSFGQDNRLVFGNFAIIDSGIYSGNVVVRIVPSTAAEARLEVAISANGKDSADAVRYQKQVSYRFDQQNKDLIISPYFKIPRSSKWRNQQVTLMLSIPIGFKIRLIENMASSVKIEGLPDESGLEALIGKDLIMTSNGLIVRKNYF